MAPDSVDLYFDVPADRYRTSPGRSETEALGTLVPQPDPEMIRRAQVARGGENPACQRAQGACTAAVSAAPSSVASS